MILSFRVKNFRSFSDDAIISMRPIKAYKEHEGNIYQHNKNVEILKIAGIYGANSSGKSNFIRAIGCMRYILFDSLRRSSVDEIDAETFELDAKKKRSPTEFDVEMLIDNYVYRYGFSVRRDRVIAEWLYRSLGGQRSVVQTLFIREKDSILTADSRLFGEGSRFDITTLLPNALLLPRLDQLNNSIAKAVMGWFRNLKVLSGLSSFSYAEYSVRHVDNVEFREKMKAIIRLADSSIENISVDMQRIDINELPQDFRRKLLNEKRDGFVEARTVLVERRDVQGNHVPFDLDEKESEGTKKIFEMSGPLVDILNSGAILVIDELEAKLHPALTRKLLSLFQSERWNPKNAQLIFVTHDVTLLRYAKLRRDQIWFCEKGKECRSELYCLAEIKSSARTRQDDNIEKRYLEGRYGALPEFTYFGCNDYQKR